MLDSKNNCVVQWSFFSLSGQIILKSLYLYFISNLLSHIILRNQRTAAVQLGIVTMTEARGQHLTVRLSQAAFWFFCPACAEPPSWWKIAVRLVKICSEDTELRAKTSSCNSTLITVITQLVGLQTALVYSLVWHRREMDGSQSWYNGTLFLPHKRATNKSWCSANNNHPVWVKNLVCSHPSTAAERFLSVSSPVKVHFF